VTGSPLWNFGPWRSTNSQVRPSLDMLHDSASDGVLSPPGMGFTSASCSAYMTMNGVISASVSPVSSQRVASVTCTPHVTVPLGSAALAAPTLASSASRRADIAIGNRWLMSSPFAGFARILYSTRGTGPCGFRPP